MQQSDVPILVHVGPHKTGTTWLQKNLLSPARGIVYEPSFEPSHAAFLLPRYGEFTPEASRRIYAPLLEQARADGKPLVISDEALGGWPFGQRFLREIAAERIALAFPQARILITTREQDALLLSMYSEYLRYGFSSSLQAFLTQDTGKPNLQPVLDLGFYEWDRVREFYESIFGAEQVLTVPMEWGLAAPTNYPSILEPFLGRPLGVPDDLEIGQVARPSLSSWALEVLRRANMLHPQDTRYLHRPSRLSPNSLAYQVDRITPKAARKRGKQAMRAIVRPMIGDRFADSNRRLQSRSSHDLAALGYLLNPTKN